MNKELRNRIIMLNLFMTCVIAVYHFGNAATSTVAEWDARANELICTYIDLIEDLAMNYFFTVTGLLLFTGFTIKNYLPKLRRRFMTVLVPYLVWQLIFGLKGLIDGEIASFVRTVFLLEKYPPDGPLWYMYAILYLAVLSPVFYLPLKHKKIGFISVVLFIAGSYYMIETDNPVLKSIELYGHLPNVFSYMASYIMGLYLGLHLGDGDKDTVLALLVTVLAFGFLLNPFWEGFLAYLAQKVIPVLLLFTLPTIRSDRFYKYAGGSFLIYALHDVIDWRVFGRVRRVALKLCSGAWFVNLFCRAATLVLVAFLAAALWILLSLFCPGILKLLTGGRVKPVVKPLAFGKHSETEA